VQKYGIESLECAQKYRLETVFLFVMNRLGFFALVHLYRIEMGGRASAIGRGVVSDSWQAAAVLNEPRQNTQTAVIRKSQGIVFMALTGVSNRRNVD
jgi:hypothetical protein